MPWARRSRLPPASPAAVMRKTSTAGKRSPKPRPRRSVTRITRRPRAMRARASASAGNIWPPVPPAASRIAPVVLLVAS